MEKKYKIAIFAGVILVVVIVLVEGIFIFLQQKQIGKLINGGNSLINGSELSKETQKELSDERLEMKKNIEDNSRKNLIESSNVVTGIVKSVSDNSIVVDAEVLDLNEINKTEFSSNKALVFSKIQKTYTISLTDKTKMDKKPTEGDLVDIYSEKSVLGVDSFDAVDVKIEKSAEDIKKE